MPQKPTLTDVDCGHAQATAGLDAPQTAAYIADMAHGLSGLARKADLPVLICLLEMVMLEGRKDGEAP